MVLEYKNLREELEYYLGQLADPEGRPIGRNCAVSLDYAIHFLFDDTILSAAPWEAIGWYLHDQQEVEHVSRVIRAIDRVLNVNGVDRNDSFYLKCPEWLRVRDAAAATLVLLRERDSREIG